ncbi:AAA family ATPase [Mahella sp.]|uniref:ATP-binding protein n=1 Tax=Mahella sp. TaxID=2798721 RepID=UPI0025C481B9|nr:AAA family ATPase [Mahella sp.]MBZ4665986.1 hypothetical protein [Mahella sp.]
MIIRKLYISNFGKFKDNIIELKPGLNVIYGVNEAGKSTIRSFIEGMLYGFKKPDARRRSFTDDRQRYRPWVGASYTGAIEYEIDSRVYRIERDFANDRVNIYDAATGEDIGAICAILPGTREPDVIIRHWGLNATVFANTISIDQRNAFSSKAMAKEVSDAWINMMQSGQQDVSVNKALSSLNNLLDGIGSDNAPTRPWAKAAQKLQQLKAERAMAQKCMDDMRQSIAKAHDLRKEIAAIRDGRMSDNTAILTNRHNRTKLEYELDQLNALNEYIKQNDGDLLERLMSLDRQLEGIRTELAQYDRSQSEVSDNALRSIKKRRTLYIILAAAISAASIALPPLIIAVIPLIWLFLRDNSKMRRLKSALDQHSMAVEQQRQQLLNRYETLEGQKREILAKIGASDTSQVISMMRRLDNLTHDIERLDAEYERLMQQAIHDKEVELTALEASVDASLAGIRPLAAIDEDIQSIRNDIDAMSLKKQAAQKAIDVITELSADIQRDFAPYLDRSAASLAGHITGGRYSSLRVSSDLDIKVIDPDTDKLVPLEQLSAGTIDQLYIAVRLAIADILSGNKPLPIIIDDAFSEYDDIRLKRALEYIIQLAQKRQVLFLTCHQRDIQALYELKAPFDCIEL